MPFVESIRRDTSNRSNCRSARVAESQSRRTADPQEYASQNCRFARICRVSEATELAELPEAAEWVESLKSLGPRTRLRRGLGVKDGPGSARAAAVSVGLRWWGSPSRHRPGQVLADLASWAKVVQTVGCSTFTHEAKPATRRVADGERMNPRGKGGAYAPIQGTTSTRTTSWWSVTTSMCPGNPTHCQAPSAMWPAFR